ncbi:hypothetical protein PPSIR1_08167 [Plesiocystis pacifica SIR-1]|uniref:N-acetyltransferase domain-containing protein n=1 Tax=Plesiocystis pacifica SIR-1 TaxID=391625 RepID=A6GE08_9BACT|nr:N-acetyltransferase [Plesiocystis pacifica]EDM75874.1 hypothetical protein PPSIR1_08167 [Plesiocystis pacifica SIR-1]
MIALDPRAPCLRRATTTDAEAFVTVKRALPMAAAAEHGATRAGGFLLGCDADGYRAMLEHGRGWVLERPAGADSPEPIWGFGLSFDDPVLRASPLWARREAVDWVPEFELERVASQRVAYIEQLAVLPSPGARRWGVALAARLLDDLIREAGHDHILTTIVLEPIHNRAALPFLRRVGARAVGTLDEDYPEAGRILSQVYLIDGQRYLGWQAEAMRAGAPGLRQLLAAAGLGGRP